MKLDLNQVYNLDCIELMKKMKQQSIEVDAIITDPPYNISRENNFSSIGRQSLDFGNWDHKFDQKKWLKYIYPIIKPGGSVIIFNDWKNMGKISIELEKNGFIIKDLIRWIKPAPMPRNTKRRYVTDYEVAVWAVKPNGKWIFNKPDDIPYLRPEIKGSTPSGKNRIHPTQKSPKAIEQLISTHTNPGDVIFDPFSGSGEISIQANTLNRYFIASEVDVKYWRSSLKRIKSTFVRPAINHLGNKYRMLGELIAQIPKEIDNFVDVFTGSAVVSASGRDDVKYFLNDYDKNLMNIIKYLISTNPLIVIENTDNLIKEYNLSNFQNKNFKKNYFILREQYNSEKRKDIRKLFTLVILGFNQQIRFNKSNKFNIPAGKQNWNEYQKNKVIDFIDAFKNKKYEFHSEDFESFTNEMLENLDIKKTIFYFDPPYYLSNATYNSNWTEEKEKKLINVLKKINKMGGKFILSNVISSKSKSNKFLLDFINKNKNINRIEINKISYSNSNYQRKKTNDPDVEVIVKNYKLI